MEQRAVGKSGLKVSAVGLGCNNFGVFVDLEVSRKVIHKALDVGITMFDTSDSYGNGASEDFLGQSLGDCRKQAVLATKFGKPIDRAEIMKGASRRHIMMAVEASLKRLKTDWIDLYEIHIPDPSTPIEETLRAMDDLVKQGKVRYIGCSNFVSWQVVEAQWTSRCHGLSAFISCIAEYSLLNRNVEHEFLPVMKSYGLGLFPAFPLAGGLLSGKYERNKTMPIRSRLTDDTQFARKFLTAENWTRAEQLTKFSQDRGYGLLELSISWLASRPLVSSIIAGATKPEQVESNAQAINWSLADAELAEVDRLTMVLL